METGDIRVKYVYILSMMIVAEIGLHWRLSGRVSSRDGNCVVVELSKYAQKKANGVSIESCEHSLHNASNKLENAGVSVEKSYGARRSS